jgi:hypothetical protein
MVDSWYSSFGLGGGEWYLTSTAAFPGKNISGILQMSIFCMSGNKMESPADGINQSPVYEFASTHLMN